MMTRVHQGFTLIEVVASCFLLSLTIYALLSILPGAMSCMRKSQTMVCANHLAQQTAELYAGADFKDLPQQPLQSLVTMDGVDYSVSLNPHALPGFPAPPNPGAVEQLDVTVKWNAGAMAGGGGNGAASVTYSLCFYNVSNHP
jgi:type II secretory pathway pseudopilin PulG